MYPPSGDHEHDFTVSSCAPTRVITAFALLVSHIFKDPSSAPEQSKLVEMPPVWNAQVHTPVVWPNSLWTNCPVRVSERQTDLSQPAEASRLPSPENEAPRTHPLCCEKDWSSFPVSPFHRATVLSAEPEASMPRQPAATIPGCHERHVTGFRWCRRTNIDSSVLRSHIRTVLSQLADARCRPPGLNSSREICHLWPLRCVCFSAETLIQRIKLQHTGRRKISTQDFALKLTRRNWYSIIPTYPSRNLLTNLHCLWRIFKSVVSQCFFSLFTWSFDVHGKAL